MKAHTTMPHGRGMKSRFYWKIFQVNAQQDEVHGPCALISPQKGAGTLDVGCTVGYDPRRDPAPPHSGCYLSTV